MASYNKKVDLKRVNINLPTKLVERVEEYALDMGLNITSAYNVLINKGLDQTRTIDAFSFLFQNQELFKGLANKNEEIDDN